MERKRFSVTYFLRKARTNKAGLTPILARITTNGISKEIYIQCLVPADKWSQFKERATGKDKLCQQVNSYLDDYRARILGVRQELISKGYEGNCIQIKERLQNPTTLSIMFLAELAKYCEKRQTEVGVRITQLTANKYHPVSERIYRCTLQERGYFALGCRLRVSRRLQHFPANSSQLQTQRRCESARLRQELHPLLSAQ